MPGHSSREILILVGNLTTCDPVEISDTIEVSCYCYEIYNKYSKALKN